MYRQSVHLVSLLVYSCLEKFDLFRRGDLACELVILQLLDRILKRLNLADLLLAQFIVLTGDLIIVHQGIASIADPILSGIVVRKTSTGLAADITYCDTAPGAVVLRVLSEGLLAGAAGVTFLHFHSTSIEFLRQTQLNLVREREGLEATDRSAVRFS